LDANSYQSGSVFKANQQSWFNHHRLLEPIGYIPPAEAEDNYYRQLVSQTATTE
jgi:hypothetical protein